MRRLWRGVLYCVGLAPLADILGEEELKLTTVQTSPAESAWVRWAERPYGQARCSPGTQGKGSGDPSEKLSLSSGQGRTDGRS